MGTSKKDQFSEATQSLAALAKALAHPARIAILQYLLESKSCMCGDIVDVLPLAQSTVSQHLKELKKVGLLQGTIEGTSVCYCIDPKAWTEAKLQLNSFLSQVVVDDTSCC